MNNNNYILAIDSANETINVGLGKLKFIEKNNTDEKNCTNKHASFNCKNIAIEFIAEKQLSAHRASNTMLIATIDDVLNNSGVTKNQISLLAAGRGPGSFTGVRICLATAKGIASALGIGLVGISTTDSVAWNAWCKGFRGNLHVLSDAMRKEVYPVLYKIDDIGIKRCNDDIVVKFEDALNEITSSKQERKVAGDSVTKYADAYKNAGISICQEFSNPTGHGLLLTTEEALNSTNALIENLNSVNAAVDTFNSMKTLGESAMAKTLRKIFNPGIVLPVYTRLSDAEETERIRLADTTVKNLNTGVKDITGKQEFHFSPMDANDIDAVEAIEKELMKSDAWNKNQFADELTRPTRTWWAANDSNGKVVAYGGANVSGCTMELLKIGVSKHHQHKKIATDLLSLLANDARDLGANECYLEVRASNKPAQSFYKSAGLSQISERKKYYSDNEDACVFKGPLPIKSKDVGGMNLKIGEACTKELNKPTFTKDTNKELIFAIESSCDETAAAILYGDEIIADVVASQVDFHKRFGGVVPEIASRKHIEAICGVCDECFEQASSKLGAKLSWDDLDAIAVTYAPGLVGALVVGMAFAKGAAWGSERPFIGVNHLEGHLYANKLQNSHISLPAVASVISGGNTILVQVNNWGDYKLLGSTIDDAVGEAFDKVAKALSLGYPGGPVISKLAVRGNNKAIAFPRAMLHSGDLRFSLSGLKTAVINYINENKTEIDKAMKDLSKVGNIVCDICASFEAAIIDVQVAKATTAIKQCNAKSFMFGGGVAANPQLRSAYGNMCKKLGIELIMAPMWACGDNAAMIALVARDRYKQQKFFDLKSDVSAQGPIDVAY